jgi:hypothetical protein
MADGGYPGRAVVGGGGGGSGGYAGRGITPVPRSGRKKKKKDDGFGLGDLLHAAATPAYLAGHLGRDIGVTAVQIGPGLVKAGGAVGHDILALEAKAGIKTPQTKRAAKGGSQLLPIVKGVGKSYADYYGHDVLHHLYEHPLQPLLDLATVASAGAAGVARGGKLAAEVGLISKESKLAQAAKLGERTTRKTRSPRKALQGKGPTQKTLSSTKPIINAREAVGQAVRTRGSAAIARAAPKVGLKRRAAYQEEGLGPEFKAYGKGINLEAARSALIRLGQYEPYARTWRRLGEDQRIATNVRSFDVHPDDLAEFWQGTDNGALLTPKVRDLILHPTKKMLAAEREARSLSEAGADLLKIDPTVRGARPELVRKQVSEMLDRQARPVHGDPYYMPHVLEPEAFRDPFRSAGGGKAKQRKLGTEKQNTGKLLLGGKLHLRGDILGPEYLRRVTKLKYDDIHDALLHGSLRVTRRELDQIFGGKTPPGYEFILEKPSQRLPVGARLESATQLVQGMLGKMPLDTETLNARLADIDRTYKQVIEKIIPEVSPFGGKLSRSEQLRRNQASARGRTATPRTRQLKAEKKALEKDPRYYDRSKGRAHQLSAWAVKERRRLDREIGASYDRPNLVKSVKEEERGLAEDFLHEHIMSSTDPGLEGIQTMVKERDAIRELLNARAEEELFGGEKLADAMPDPEYMGDSIFGQGFTTSDKNLAKLTGDTYHLVPKGMAKAATGEFTRGSALQRAIISKPLSVWRAAVLGLRPGFFVNNFVGNSLMYALKTGGAGGFRDLFAVLYETHGPEVARKILRNPATPPELRASLYKEFFPEQSGHATFGGSQSPSTSPAHAAASTVGEGYRRVTGVIPHLTSKVAEEVPRTALIRHYIRKSPEFKSVWKDLPKQTREFEDAARQVLEGGGRSYQRMISKQVDDALGNYLSLSPVERNVLRNAFPFYTWYRAIARTTFHLAADTPLRAQILGKLGQIGTQARDDEVPEYLRGAIGIGRGPGGTERVLSTGGLNPWYTLAQLGRSPNDVSEAGGNPFLMALFEAYANARPYPGGPVSLTDLAGGIVNPLEDTSLLRNLPLARALFPKGPSKMYPTRGGRTERLNWLGVPIKDYDPSRARALARQERSGR